MAIKEIVKKTGTLIKNLPSDTKWYVVGIGLGCATTFAFCRDYICQMRHDHKIYRKLEYHDAVTKTNDMLFSLNAPYYMEVEFEENDDAVLRVKKYAEADK